MFLIALLIFLFTVPMAVAFALYANNVHNLKERNKQARARAEIYKSQPELVDVPSFKYGLPLTISAGLCGALVLFESLTVVPAGHIGVQVTFGEVKPTTLSEGLHIVNPMSSIRNIEVRMVSAKLPNSSAGTKDLQQVHTEIVLNYRLDGSKAAHIYKDFGLDLEGRVILPALNESFKAVTAHYTSEELITKRDEVSAKIKEEVAGKLGKYAIGVSDISLVNFGFSAEYQKAIEAKVISTQEKLKAEQDLARIEVEAKQAVAKAEGRAKAIQIETAAINSQGGASYVQLKAIERWDGKLPATMAGNATPFINVK